MNTLNEFLGNLIYWLRESHGIDAEIANIGTDTSGQPMAELSLRDDEGEEMYVGNYADPGVTVVWFGEHELPVGRRNLVMVNNVVMEARGKHVAGWAFGYV